VTATPGAQAQVEEGSLADVRVLEVGDERIDYCGFALAGLGAQVVKVEPPGGSPSRLIGPFYEDVEDPERSLYFWAHDRGKRSIVLDPADDADRQTFAELVEWADVVLSTDGAHGVEAYGARCSELVARTPRLIGAHLSDFGEDGPWAHHRASDLVHLALGGVAMNCGYDPDPSGRYDLPPIAPQAFHSSYIAGEQLAFTVIAALSHRATTGRGQYLSCAIHEAVAKNTEADLMSWILLRTPFQRQTCRHSAENISPHQTIVSTKDGRSIMTLTRDPKTLRPFMDRYELGAAIYEDNVEGDAGTRVLPGMEAGSGRSMEAIQQLLRRWLFDDVPWGDAQNAGLMWVPLRKPEENADDEHWLARGSFGDIHHPEHDRSFRYPVSKWVASRSNWVALRRAPLVDEDRASVLASIGERSEPLISAVPARTADRLSRHGKPFALSNVRILDFSWYLATAGATRFLAGLGADVIKVEWKAKLDPRRGGAPVGGREARDAATGPVPSLWPPDLGGEYGGQYNNKNPGKRGISLNVADPRGLEIAKRLVAECDVVAEGFSPGVMEKWGLGYDVLSEINPQVIYAKQSGMGSIGKWQRFRSVGPIAASLSGLSEMSGIPEPAPPAGWGYSYLDWFGAYSFALAILTGVYHRDRTGEGQWIDASQVEVGTFLSSVPVLDHSANGRSWRRTGNHSPYALASPEGIYRCQGDDRWVAITCRNDDEWVALAKAAGHAEWATDDRFTSRDGRIRHRDELDALVTSWTTTQDRYAVMELLQGVGVPAGVAQDAQDRVELDPQLEHLSWLTELDASGLGRWPVAEGSVKMSETPPHIGGPIDRAAALYGEHNDEVYAELLGLSAAEVEELRADGVI
jgi:crotonobetainyl-CoA:carnitine CoA-transferase CaiB-like acyl-CoA transferase